MWDLSGYHTDISKVVYAQLTVDTIALVCKLFHGESYDMGIYMHSQHYEFGTWVVLLVSCKSPLDILVWNKLYLYTDCDGGFFSSQIFLECVVAEQWFSFEIIVVQHTSFYHIVR